MMPKLSWNFKIKFFQFLAFFGGPLVLILNWNLTYFLLAFIASWFIVHIGVSVGMHRCFSHRSFVPKNKVILYVLHFLSVINTIGSTITWTGTHRYHHKTADTANDPHSTLGKPFWAKIAYWFNYWPSHNVPVKIVKDLTKDPAHRFFHRNYFTILVSYILLLALIDINLFLYGYLVVTMFSLHWISWITVGAHIFGHQDILVNDKSKNTFVMGLLMWGEGWHNNHHANASSFEFGWNWKQPDLGKHFIKLIAKKDSLRYHDK